jgi:methionyl-tRNA formyltransferase
VPVAFLGTSDYAAAILTELAATGDLRPALVVTRPDRPSGRGRRVTAPPVALAARTLELPLFQPARVNDEEPRAEIARAVDGGTVVVCAFGALIREPLLSEHEILNVHPSLLPRWRGAAPVERAIMAGDAETGVSIMRLTAGLDSGPVCLAAAEPIHAGDTYGTLATRLEDLGARLIIRALRERPPCMEQDEEGATYAEKIGAHDRLLDPARPAAELERLVRALHPHIGARVALPDGTHLGVHAAAVVADADDDGRERGVAAAGGRLLLHCTPGTLELLVVQPPGGRAMDASAYLRGRRTAGRA